MKKLKPYIVIAAVLMALLAGWFSCAVWDSVFFLEGKVHVVNTFHDNADVVITFPNGESCSFILPKGHWEDFEIDATGEGAIGVKVNGNELKCDSYVTSFNGMVMLSIGQDQVFQSSIRH